MHQYSHGHSPVVLAAHGVRTAEDSAAYLLPHLCPGMSLLDIGCGPGTITRDLARAVAPGPTVGVDASPAAVESARGGQDSAGGPAAGSDDETMATPACEPAFHVADVYDLPFEEGSFDVVHAHQVLQHLPDPVGALRSMARTCAPGGVIAARDADYRSMAWFPDSAGISRWLEIYRSMARANGGEPDAGRFIRRWARLAGLQEVTVTASSWCYASAEQVRWWGSSWAERVHASSYGPRAVELGLSTPQELREISAAWDAWSRDPDAWFAMTHTELIARPATG